MAFTTEGFHHVTMVSRDAQRTLAFYRDLLGLRLVKKTVNFDIPNTYHLYFGDDTGSPGSILTFFEWPDAARGRYGVGGIHHIALKTANDDTLLKWKRRLTDHGVPVSGPYNRGWFHSIYFRDPDGQVSKLRPRGRGTTSTSRSRLSAGNSKCRPRGSCVVTGTRRESPRRRRRSRYRKSPRTWHCESSTT